jgi:flagellar protein FlgJ
MNSIMDALPLLPAAKFDSVSLEKVQARPPHQLHEAAQEFEAYFLSYLFKTMRDTVPSGLLENKAGQMFYSFYDQELARRAAEVGGIGLAAMIAKGLEQQLLSAPPVPLKFPPLPSDKGTDEGKSLGSHDQGS